MRCYIQLQRLNLRMESSVRRLRLNAVSVDTCTVPSSSAQRTECLRIIGNDRRSSRAIWKRKKQLKMTGNKSRLLFSSAEMFKKPL